MRENAGNINTCSRSVGRFHESRVGVLEAAVLLRVAHGGQHERTRLAQVLRLLRRRLGIGARRFRRRCCLRALVLVLVRGHLFQRREH